MEEVSLLILASMESTLDVFSHRPRKTKSHRTIRLILSQLILLTKKQAYSVLNNLDCLGSDYMFDSDIVSLEKMG